MIRASVMKEQHTLVPEKTCPMILDDLEVQDIDTFDDWNIAEIKYRKMIENSEAAK